jgi:hypothetical protein
MSAKKQKPIVRESTSGYGGGEIVLYRAPDGTVKLDVRLERETIWLTQAQMVMLFGRDQSVIARHLRNVFAEGELPASESNMQKMHIAGADRPVVLYAGVSSSGSRRLTPRGSGPSTMKPGGCPGPRRWR